MTCCEPIHLAYKLFESTNDSSIENPIIFIHGIGSSKESWSDIPQKVAEATKRRVYSVDMRNHGDSDWSDRFDYDSNVDDLFNFIGKLQARKCIVVGHSFGACICMKAALKMPTKIEKIVIEDMGVILPSTDFQDYVKSVVISMSEAVPNIPAHFSMEDGIKFVRDFVYESLPGKIKLSVKKTDLVPESALEKNADGVFQSKTDYKVLVKFFQHEAVNKWQYEGVYNGPAYFIYGEKSSMRVSQEVEDIRERFPSAKFLAIKDATHQIHNDMPDLFLEALLKCLSE